VERHSAHRELRRTEIDSDEPHPLLPPHIDPWTWTVPVPADPASEAIVRAWLDKGDLAAAREVHIDDTRTGVTYEPVLDVERVVVNDLFSAGADVPFHVTIHGVYRGGLGPSAEGHVGEQAKLYAAGVARVADGGVDSVRAVTARLQTLSELTGTTRFV
jgi:hypothetical protein